MSNPNSRERLVSGLDTHEPSTIHAIFKDKLSVPGQFNPGQAFREWQQGLSKEFIAGSRIAVALAVLAATGWALDQYEKANVHKITVAQTDSGLDSGKGQLFGPSLAEIDTNPTFRSFDGQGQAYGIKFSFPQGWEVNFIDPRSDSIVFLTKGAGQFKLIRPSLDTPLQSFSQYEDEAAKRLGFQNPPRAAIMLGQPGYELRYTTPKAFVNIRMIQAGD